MKKVQVTAQQVAERAGVSLTTVSFVMNNKVGVNISEATRQKVFMAAEELGYFPHIAARSLAQGRSPNLGLLLIRPHSYVFVDPFVPNVITGFSEVVKAEGFRILVEHIEELDHLDTIEKMLRGGEIGGAVVSGFVWGKEDLLLPLLEDGYPVVTIDAMKNPAIPYVEIDHLRGVEKAIQHMVALGHTRIGCITYGATSNPPVAARLQRFRQTLENAGIPYDESLVRVGEYEPETGYAAMLSLLNEKMRPTAIFGMNDMMALGAVSAIQEAGLRVPDDIAVVGYDNMRFASYLYPRLTTVHAPEIELGRQAGQLIMRLIHDKTSKPQHVTLNTELIIRDTCGAKLR